MNLNITAFLSKVTIGLTLLYVGLVFSQVTSPDAGSSDCECGEPANVWYKVSSGSEDYGKVVQLDMSKGQAFSDQMYIYIIVKDVANGDNIVVAFPNGGDWVAETVDPFLNELEKEFKNLEDYLRSKQGDEIEKEYK